MHRIHTTTMTGLAMLMLTLGARADDETLVAEAMVAGFAAHIQAATGGRVDWTAGVILAEGRGIAEATSDQGQLMAKRAATLDAAANALAIAAGLNVDAHGRAGAVRNGRVLLEGVIKGHEVVETTWRPDLQPPEMRVVLRVPLWGVTSVSAVLYDAYREHVSAAGLRRISLVTERVDVSDAVLVIDARGTGLQTALFPVVVNQAGEVLQDAGRLSGESAKQRPAARYVQSELSYEQLRSGLDGSPLDEPGAARARLAAYAEPAPPPETQPAASQPASAPGEDSHRRAKKHVTIKAAAAAGDQPARVVVTSEDAEKLRRSAEGASLLSAGQVVIVVDSAAAGIQGRLDPASAPDSALASLPEWPW
jgi:hypothetical protein